MEIVNINLRSRALTCTRTRSILSTRFDDNNGNQYMKYCFSVSSVFLPESKKTAANIAVFLPFFEIRPLPKNCSTDLGKNAFPCQRMNYSRIAMENPNQVLFLRNCIVLSFWPNTWVRSVQGCAVQLCALVIDTQQYNFFKILHQFLFWPLGIHHVCSC